MKSGEMARPVGYYATSRTRTTPKDLYEAGAHTDRRQKGRPPETVLVRVQKNDPRTALRVLKSATTPTNFRGNMKVYEFTVDQPMGAVRMTQYSKWTDPRAKRYAEYKRRVRLIANCHGVPDTIKENERVKVEIDVCWEQKARADIDNVLKALVDSLWRQDRRVSSIRAEHQENCEVCMMDVKLTLETI